MQEVVGDEDWQKRKKIPACPSCTLHKQKRNEMSTNQQKTLSVAHAPQSIWQLRGST